jgi:glycosyltransferase involved in cell wall biosynthesis
MFSIPNLIPFVENLVLNSPDMDVHIGFEVARVGENLRLSSKANSKIFWSPIPSTKQISWEGLNEFDPPIRIGFLGAARKLKGFENVPKIIQRLVSSGKRFEFYVQLAAEEWDGYRKILGEIRELEGEIIFLEGGCSDELLLQTISKLDCLILPYFIEEYRNAGSGLLFHAADFGVPVISMHGVGFDWDIQQYSLGTLCNSSEEIPNQVRVLDRKKYLDSIRNYNLARNEITTALLSFEKRVD